MFHFQMSAHFKASLSPPRWDNDFWQQTPSPDVPCPVLQQLTGRRRQPKMTPAPPPHPCSLLASLTLFPILLMGTNPGSQSDRRNKSCVFPVLCSILFILYSYFYILYFYKLFDFHGCVSESHCHSGAVVILFNMHFIILSILLFLETVPFSYSPWKYLRVFSWELTYTFNKGIKHMLN